MINSLKKLATIARGSLGIAPLLLGASSVAHASPLDIPSTPSESCATPGAPAVWDITAIQDTARLADDCAPLAPGDSRLVTPTLFNSDPRLAGLSYRITADSERSGVLHITLREKFRAWDGIKRKKEQEDQIRERANACLAALAPWLRGPEGQELQIRYEEKSEATRKLKPQGIDILTQERSNSGQWDSDLGCGSIVHETFHLLGLVDEYKEEELGYRRSGKEGNGPWVPTAFGATLPAYDCRRVRQNDSLMGNHFEALRQLTPLYRMKNCLCPEGDEACLTELRSWTTLDQPCPERAITATQDDSIFVGADLGKGKAPFELCSAPPLPNERRVCGVIERAPGRGSLLLPDQFNAVVYPRCTPMNARYRACAANAYRTSVENRGTGCSKAHLKACQAVDP